MKEIGKFKDFINFKICFPAEYDFERRALPLVPSTEISIGIIQTHKLLSTFERKYYFPQFIIESEV